MDYAQLPAGKKTLTRLQKSHPDVQANYDNTNTSCKLYGAYSDVQSALAQLLGHPGGPQSAEHSGQPATSGSRSDNATQKPHSLEKEDQSRKLHERREQEEKDLTSSNEFSSQKDLKHDGYEWDSKGQPERGALQPTEYSPTLEDDLLLIMDADMFQYLQKCCGVEYQHILSQYGVEVVDVTSQGLTSLFLKVAAAVGEGGDKQERMKSARRAISELYQENETKICQAQLSKSILSPRGGLQRAMESLSVKLPKLLLNEDDRNVYFIGSSSDVTEAKQHLLLDHHEKQDATNLLRLPSFASGSSSAAGEKKDLVTLSSSTTGSLEDRIDQMLRSEEGVEGARKYKLAARFKDSGLSTLSNRPGDFTLRGLSAPTRQTRPGGPPGLDTRSETVRVVVERVPRAAAQNTGGDILFNSGDTSMETKTYFNSDLMDAKPKSTKAIRRPTQPNISGSTSLPPAGYNSGLKRSGSFSGKPESVSQKIQDDSGKSNARPRGRSSSFSNQKGRENGEVYNAEMTVSSVMWHYIKEVYIVRVEDLSSDVQIKESSSQGVVDTTIIIRGADQSKVMSCLKGLQTLFDTVSASFALQELSLSELGVDDPANESLQACCAQVCSRFKKVTIRMTKKSILLLGPKELCSEVATSLRMVFSGDLTKRREQASNWTPSTCLINEDPRAILHSNSQAMLESQRDCGTSRQVRRTNLGGDPPEIELVDGSMWRDPVSKEKLRWAGTVDLDGQNTIANSFAQGNDESASRGNGVGSTSSLIDKVAALHKKERTTLSVQKEQGQQGKMDVQDILKESRTGQRDRGCICVCGVTEASMKRTECGATMCSKCLDTVHAHCRVCHRMERRGILGEMSHSKLNITVPGYNKDPAIKITYCIPDGIQGVRGLL